MLNIYLLTLYFCNNIDIRAQFGKVFNSEGYFSQNCGIVLWTLVRNWGLLTFPFCPFPRCRKELGFCACVYGKGWELGIGKRMGWGWLCEGWGSCQGRERNSLPLDMTKHNSKGESRGAGSGRLFSTLQLSRSSQLRPKILTGAIPECSYSCCTGSLFVAQQVFCAVSPSVPGKQH